MVEQSLLRRKASLMGKLPDIHKTLDAVNLLQKRQEASEPVRSPAISTGCAASGQLLLPTRLHLVSASARCSPEAYSVSGLYDRHHHGSVLYDRHTGNDRLWRLALMAVQVLYEFELGNSVWAKAKIPPTKAVNLWLGADVMVEYPIEEAKQLLVRIRPILRFTVEMIMYCCLSDRQTKDIPAHVSLDAGNEPEELQSEHGDYR